jgi:hypothetical protein
MNIEDIPSIPDRDKRFEEITVDCYDEYEVLSAFEVYLTDALQTPLAATWRDPDEPDHVEPVTVLGVADLDDRRGVLMKVRRENGKERRVLAEQLWADDVSSANAIVLDDYRTYVDQGSLPFDEYDEE